MIYNWLKIQLLASLVQLHRLPCQSCSWSFKGQSWGFTSRSTASPGPSTYALNLLKQPQKNYVKLTEIMHLVIKSLFCVQSQSLR